MVEASDFLGCECGGKVEILSGIIPLTVVCRKCQNRVELHREARESAPEKAAAKKTQKHLNFRS